MPLCPKSLSSLRVGLPPGNSVSMPILIMLASLYEGMKGLITSCINDLQLGNSGTSKTAAILFFTLSGKSEIRLVSIACDNVGSGPMRKSTSGLDIL